MSILNLNKGLLVPSGYKQGHIFYENPISNEAFFTNNGTNGNYVLSNINYTTNENFWFETKLKVSNTTSTLLTIVSRFENSATGSYSLFINPTTNKLILDIIDPTGGTYSNVSNIIPNFDINKILWLAVSRDSSNGEIKFYSKNSENETYSQFGSTQISYIGSLRNNGNLRVGAQRTTGTNPFNGSIYYVKGYNVNNNSGNPLFFFDPNKFDWTGSYTQNGGSLNSSTGEIWTITSTGVSYIYPMYESFTFSRSSSGSTRTNFNGIIENVSSNIPRLLYLSANTCPGILFEPSRTNLVLASESLLSLPWVIGGNLSRATTNILSRSGVTITANINGSINNSGADLLSQANAFNVTSGLTYTFSIIVKKTSNHNSIGIWCYSVAGTYSVNYNVDTLVYTPTSNANFTNRSGGVIPLGDNSFLCWEKFNVVSSVISSIGFAPCNSASLIYSSGNSISLTAVQLEVGSFPTTYIPTQASIVTRSSDLITNGLNNRFLNLGTKGTILFDVTIINRNFSTDLACLGVGTVGTEVWLLNPEPSGFGVYDTKNQRSIIQSNPSGKFLIKFDNGYTCGYYNGVKQNEYFSGIPLNITSIFGTNRGNFSYRLNNFQTYPIALSDEDCAQLTS